MHLPEKRIHSGNAGRDALRTVWLTYCEIIYKNKYVTHKKNVKKNVGEAGISHNGLKSGDLRLVAFAEARRKTASMDAGAPERG